MIKLAKRQMHWVISITPKPDAAICNIFIVFRTRRPPLGEIQLTASQVTIINFFFKTYISYKR